ncbi:type I restriction enzyme, S subunit [Tangfeifania diversioriginum]|uniref:Type I restriction enzyme, S subunit n=1 Tax=Tangfeifania diversioriginum TaxID=1168035 RepID=A0A1M6JM84_9BACT|nr:restriction endonuclease subunit S [Tangfeifania diversioriginum]SHJ47806.1 type I restriction enzyme, S subunit [Tangfeifania diversioriginum]
MSDWREIKFGDLLAEPVRNGIYKKKEFHGRGAKIVNMGELFAHPRLTDISMERVEISDKERKKVLLREGDLIFARRSLTAEGAGKCTLIKEIKEDTTFESSIIRARPDIKKALPEYIFYFFNSYYGKYLLGTILRQVAVSGITGTDLMNLKFKIPPLPEQKAIAEVFSSLDDKIDLLHRQNQTLEQMAETLFRKWFVEDASEEWETGTLEEEFDITMGQSPPGSSYNENGDGSPMYQGNKDFGFRFPANRVFTTEPKRIAKKHDTLISVRAPVGEQNMASENCCIGRGVAAFIYKKDSSFYTYTYYKMKSLMDEIKAYNNEGTVFGSISKKDFQRLEVLIPPDNYISEYQGIAKPLDEKIYNNSIQIEGLKKLRDGLLPKLMNGEVKVNT